MDLVGCWTTRLIGAIDTLELLTVSMTGERGRDKGEAEATAVANGDRLDNDLWDKVGDGVEERCPEDVGLCAMGIPETADICGYLCL